VLAVAGGLGSIVFVALSYRFNRQDFEALLSLR